MFSSAGRPAATAIDSLSLARSTCPKLSPSRSANCFFRRWRQHADPRPLAGQLSVSVRTVQRLFARFRSRGAAAIAPDYRACGRSQPRRAATPLIEDACRTRRQHPRWGTEMIRLELEARHPDLPAARTLRRHLRAAGLQPAPAGRTPAAEQPFVARATLPHQGWQVDACEELHLRGRQRACWLRVVDECSGAFLHTTVYAAARWEHIDRHTIRDGLRRAFARWGLPGRLRVDNGYPWGSSADLPPELALWLIGLGVEVIWIPPGRPQHNGVVERAQGTGQNWAEPHTCGDAAELQRRLDELDRRQRERYPYRGGRGRLEVYPQLAHSGRRYSHRGEASAWEVERVWAAVAQRVVVRQVDRTGCVSVYHRNRYVGKPYIGTAVYVSLDPGGPTWVIADERGAEVRTHAAEELSAERVRSLSVGCRKGKGKRP